MQPCHGRCIAKDPEPIVECEVVSMSGSLSLPAATPQPIIWPIRNRHYLIYWATHLRNTKIEREHDIDHVMFSHDLQTETSQPTSGGKGILSVRTLTFGNSNVQKIYWQGFELTLLYV